MTQIQSISAWRVALPLLVAFGNASSRVWLREVVIVRLTGDGVHGWGEAAPFPGHAGRPIDVLWSDLRREVGAGGLDAISSAQGLLRAGFRQARDDLSARRDNRPLWSMLGGRNRIHASAAIGVDDADQPDRTQLEAVVAAGYRHAKLKITPRTDPRRIGELMTAHPQMQMGLDANGSLGENDSGLIKELDNLGAAYLEQPGSPGDLAWHRTLRSRLQTPIALDESADSAVSIESILEAGAADILTIKVGRFGTSRAVALAERAVARGVSARVGGLIETGIGRAHAVAAASHPVFAIVGDVAASDRYFKDDLVRPQWRLDDGHIELPTEPGIGVAVDEEALDEHTVDSLIVD